MGGARPTGTVTFLFTDLVGSTQLWEQHADAMRVALARHDKILRSAIESADGYVFSTAGDAFAAAFQGVDSAIEAAVAAQLALAVEDWPPPVRLQVRMGLHTGEAVERAGDYFGPTVNRAARLMSVAHGGQILLSHSAADLARSADLLDLGEHRLKDLLEPERVFQVGGDAYPPLRSLDAARNNLPAQRTELLGREEDVAAIAALVGAHRLVTLTGFGGTGKTRLALAAAAEVADRFPRGVFFVDLAPLTAGDLVGLTAGEVVGISAERLAGEGPTHGRAAAALAEQDLLLVLDNCEHLIDDCVEFVDLLLNQAAGPTVLATSREALEIDGEHQYRVSPLELGPGSPAIELFVQRAGAAGTVVDPDDPAVTSICQRLDGLPLAIELAAARTATLRPADLARRLGDQLDLLASRRRQRGRHRSLQAVLEWSWDLLDPDTRDLLVQLGVFNGGWTLEAAEAVCDDSASVAIRLETLVAGSLVEPTWSAERSRFRMLEPVRQFSISLLDEDPRREDLEARHLDWWLARCRQRSTGQQWFSATWATEINDDFDDFRAVIDRALATGRIDDASELLGGTIAGIFDGRHPVEVDRVLDQLALATPEPAARVLLAGAFNDIGIGRHVRLAERLEAARANSRCSGDTACEAVATTYQAFSSANIDPGQAMALSERGVELARLVDDPEIVGLALGWAGATAFIAADHQAALRWLDEARVQSFEEPSLAHFHCLFAEAFVLLGVGDVDAAEATLDEGLHHLSQASGTRRTVHGLKAFWHARRSEVTAIVERANEGLDNWLARGEATHLPDAALATCELLELAGRPQEASDLCAALHRQPLTHPLIYHRYRSLRSRLPEHATPSHRLSPTELHEVTMRHLETLQAE